MRRTFTLFLLAAAAVLFGGCDVDLRVRPVRPLLQPAELAQLRVQAGAQLLADERCGPGAHLEAWPRRRVCVSARGEAWLLGSSITPITSFTASGPTQLGGSTSGSFYASADRLDIKARSTGTATLYLVEWDVASAKWWPTGPACSLDSTVNNGQALCRYVGKRGPTYWHVIRTAGTTAEVYLEQAYNGGGAALGSIEPAAAAGAPVAHAASHEDGGGDEVALDASQIESGTLAVGRGGTGISTYTAGDLLYASGPATLAVLAAGAEDLVLTSSGPGSAPTWEPPAAPTGSGAALTGVYAGFLSGGANILTNTNGDNWLLSPGSGLTASGGTTQLFEAPTSLVLQRLACRVTTVCGDGNSITFTVQSSSDGTTYNNSLVTCTIAGSSGDGSLKCEDVVQTLSLSQHDAVAFKAVASSCTTFNAVCTVQLSK